MNSSDDALIYNGLYDTYRTCKLNEIYNFTMAQRVNKQLVIFDIITAVLSTVLPILLVTHLNLPALLFSVVVLILNVVRPVLQLPQRQVRYMVLYREYMLMRLEFEDIVEQVKVEQGLSDTDKRRYLRLRAKLADLGTHGDAVQPPQRLIRRLQDAVNQQIPIENLWWPNSSNTEHGDPATLPSTQ
jgi:hypothetical protein